MRKLLHDSKSSRHRKKLEKVEKEPKKKVSIRTSACSLASHLYANINTPTRTVFAISSRDYTADTFTDTTPITPHSYHWDRNFYQIRRHVCFFGLYKWSGPWSK